MDSQLRLTQSSNLTITPQLQQAIHLLQLSYHELQTFLQQHIDQNPFLSSTEEQSTEDYTPEDHLLDSSSLNSDSFGSFSAHRTVDIHDLSETVIPASPLTLREHLIQHIGSAFSSPHDRFIGSYLAQFIQPTGYFEGKIDTISTHLGVTLSQVEHVLEKMQRFEPSGICSQSLKQCLWIQLEDRGLLNACYEILLNHLPLVAQGEIDTLARKCHTTPQEIRHMIQEIRRLNPKPGLIFDNEKMAPMVPEVLMSWDTDHQTWNIRLNPETLPKILLNQSYYTQVHAQVSETPDKRYVSSQLSHANWLIKALHQRSITLLRVATEIVTQQQDFFHAGINGLKPLILKDIAKILDLHESTISRVTTHKYIATPRGTFELKYFFSSSLETVLGISTSSETVRHRIQTLISEESGTKPLSDDAIAALLQKEGIDIARRTIAKYREILGISPAFQRKRWRKLGMSS